MKYLVTIQQAVNTLANYLAWGQSWGAAFSSFGWQAQTGHGENIASGSGGTYAWTNVAAAPTTALAALASYNFRGAWVSGTTYTGSNTDNNTADVVTNGGLTYVHITASSSLTTAPDSDATNWQPLIFEIWKSNGSNSSALPIYVKIIYTTNANSTTPVPVYLLSIGTGLDSSGNITNPITLTGTSPVTIAKVGPVSTTAGSSTTADMAFSGDADNFRVHAFRGSTLTSSVNAGTLVIERSITATGTYSNAFVYVGSCLSIANSATPRSSVILNSSFGNVITQSSNGWVGSFNNGASAGSSVSLSNFGAISPLPIYPIVGFVANPLLGCMGFNRPDVTDGQVLPVWMYGASHNYLVSSAPASSSGPGFALNNVGANGVVPAILWE